MKIIKARYDLILFFFLPFCLITTLIYYFQFDEFIHLAGVNWLFTISLLLFVLCPKASTTLDIKFKKMNLINWIAKLFFSQLLFGLLTWCFVKIISIDIETGNYFTHFDLSQFSFSSGLFPWGFTILTALTLGYFTYHKKKLGLLSSAFQPLFKNSHQDSIGIAVDSYMRFIPFCTMIFIFTMITLSIILLLQTWLHFSLASGLQMKVALIGCILLFLISQPHWIKFLHRLMYHNVPTVYILLGFTVALGLIYPLINRLSELLVAINAYLDVSQSIGGAEFRLSYIQILVTFWWLSLAAINGAYIAYISQGRSFRQIIIFSFITNLLGGWAIMFLEKIITSSLLELLPFFGMISLGILVILIMLSKQNFTYFLRATIPTEEPIKVRSSFRFLKIVPLATVSFLCAYFGMNVRVWSYLTVLGYLPPIILLVISYIGLMKGLKVGE